MSIVKTMKRIFIRFILIGSFLYVIAGIAWQSINQPIANIVKFQEDYREGFDAYWTVQVGTIRKPGLYTRRILKNGEIYKEQLSFDGELYEIFANNYVTMWRKGKQTGISELPPDAYRWYITGKFTLDEYFEIGPSITTIPKVQKGGPIQRLPHW